MNVEKAFCSAVLNPSTKTVLPLPYKDLFWNMNSTFQGQPRPMLHGNSTSFSWTHHGCWKFQVIFWPLVEFPHDLSSVSQDLLMSSTSPPLSSSSNCLDILWNSPGPLPTFFGLLSTGYLNLHSLQVWVANILYLSH